MPHPDRPDWYDEPHRPEAYAPDARPDWYARRNELRAGQVFATTEGGFVQLDGRVEGDGTRWHVALWDARERTWVYDQGEVEPGDLVGQPMTPEALASQGGASDTPGDTPALG